MTRHLIAPLTVALFACGGTQPRPSDRALSPAPGVADADQEESTASTDPGDRSPSRAGDFAITDADKASRPTQAKLQATATEAAVRLFVVDKDQGPIEGIVISLTSPTGQTYHAAETDQDGFTEVLVPIGQTYELVYLSLGRRDTAATVTVADKPNLNLKLTMRYKREEYPDAEGMAAPSFVLDDVHFPAGKATLTASSHARLDELVEYMTHKPTARIEIAGHTDNVGNKNANKQLSRRRADAVRAYLVSRGIDAGRIFAIGYGDERPLASNDTPEGRQQNRRIEANER